MWILVLCLVVHLGHLSSRLDLSFPLPVGRKEIKLPLRKLTAQHYDLNITGWAGGENLEQGGKQKYERARKAMRKSASGHGLISKDKTGSHAS